MTASFTDRGIRTAAWALCAVSLAACTTTTDPNALGSADLDRDSGATGAPGWDCASDSDLYPYTVEVIGRGLEGAEGANVYVYTAMVLGFGDVTCTGSGQTVVAGGTFELTVASHSDGAAYPRVVVWIDLNGNGICETTGDLLHDQFWTVWRHTSRTFTPVDFKMLAGPEACDTIAGDAWRR